MGLLTFLEDNWFTVFGVPVAGFLALNAIGKPLWQFHVDRMQVLRALEKHESLGKQATLLQRQDVERELGDAANNLQAYASGAGFAINWYCAARRYHLAGAAANLRGLIQPVLLEGIADLQKHRADTVRVCLGATGAMPAKRVQELREQARSLQAVPARFRIDASRVLSPTMQTFGTAVSNIQTMWDARWSVVDTFIEAVLTKRIDAIPRQHINEAPRASVIVAALNAVPNAEGPVLHELWANLIASEMDKRSANGVLPSFAEILKELSPDEARILDAIKDGGDVPIVRIQQAIFKEGHKTGAEDVEKNLSHIGVKAGCQFPTQAPMYLDNLARLRLIEFLAYGTKYPDHLYADLKADPEIEKLRLRYDQPPEKQASLIPSGLELTALGRSFIKACVAPKTPPALGN
jgi:hypothetical protein